MSQSKTWKTYGSKGVSLSEETRMEIQKRIKESDRVLDVGSAKCIFNRADYILDILSYEDRSTNKSWGPEREFFTKESWVQSDIHEKFPFEDKYFDFSMCTHTLEDIKDPISVCKELIRVSKSGYIECPSREIESVMSLKTPGLVGYGNHRWFVDIEGNIVTFTNKTPYVYTDSSLTLDRKDVSTTYVGLFWNDSFDVKEKVLIGTKETIEDQRSFVEKIKNNSYSFDNCHSGFYKA